MQTFSFNKLTIAGRIIVFTTTLVVISSLILSIFLIQAEQSSFQDSLEDQALTLLNTLRFAADNNLANFDIATLQNLADELRDSQVIVRFYTGDGRLVASNAINETNLYYFETDIDGLNYITLDSPQFNWNPETLSVAQAIKVGDQVVGATSVQLSTSPLQAKIINIQNQTLLLALLIIVVGWIASILVSRSITRPIYNLIEATKSVANGVYENRIQLQGESTPEVKELVLAFDTLINNTIEQRLSEMEEVAARERENSRLKDEFLAVMSHELRTPLNAIIGFLGIIKIKANLDDKNQHRLDRARANSERLLSLINDILDISRIESGRVEVMEAPLDVNQFFDNVKSQMVILAEEKNLEFKMNVDPDLPPTLMADEGLLSKIVINLIGNGFKFTDEGYVSLQVRKKNKNWEIEVSDTGMGIPYHMQDVIFQRFRQVDGSSKRQHEGTGLGLAIVNSLVKELDGTLVLKSQPEQGSTFTVSLPMNVPKSEALTQET